MYTTRDSTCAGIIAPNSFAGKTSNQRNSNGCDMHSNELLVQTLKMSFDGMCSRSVLQLPCHQMLIAICELDAEPWSTSRPRAGKKLFVIPKGTESWQRNGLT